MRCPSPPNAYKLIIRWAPPLYVLLCVIPSGVRTKEKFCPSPIPHPPNHMHLYVIKYI